VDDLDPHAQAQAQERRPGWWRQGEVQAEVEQCRSVVRHRPMVAGHGRRRAEL
jgi:hypothetical protein